MDKALDCIGFMAFLALLVVGAAIGVIWKHAADHLVASEIAAFDAIYGEAGPEFVSLVAQAD